MDCRTLEQILDTHALRTLADSERAALLAHAAACARCGDTLLAYRTLSDEAVAGPRAGLWEETLARVASQSLAGTPAIELAPARSRAHAHVSSHARVRRMPLPLPALGFAAAIVIAIVSWLVLGQERPLDSDDSAESSLQARAGALASESPVAAAASNTSAAGSPLSASAGADRSPGAQTGSTTDQAQGLAALQAGRDYLRLATPAPTSVASGQIEVCEFFSFDCIHCFNFEALLTAWDEQLPAHVELLRVPVVYDERRRLQARAFYTAEALGVIDRLRLAWFEEIHERDNYLATREDFRRFFVSRGVDPASFDEVFDSFGVDASVRRAELLTREYGITSTPSMGVNGRYLVPTPAGGTHQDMLGIVDTLVAAEAPERERCAGDAAGTC